MRRSVFTYFIFACLLGVIVFVGMIMLSGVIDNNSARLQSSPNAVESDTLEEVQHMLSKRLQQGDVENGRKIFKQCAACHTSGRNQSHRVGPTLWEIVDRPFAIIEGFTYSRALRANSDKKWDFLTLDRYIQSPRKAIPGTIMSFRGLKNDQDRADLLLYLRSLSNNPVSLPVDNEDGEED
ncbi:c-type cytochrome [Bartonella sp. A05]|uniref:c-type cytochrome n=1 Tax=Bartonella sp. A05 TaxID=2967261 RepID=UPI0022A9B70F|nr:cytochrome c family protein [Bartonella sp. A05]MCZ2203376.1 cytochrome c family protein [Bartonella sp. A05]